jgi:hypothetical protein
VNDASTVEVTERVWDAELRQYVTVRKSDGVVVQAESPAIDDPVVQSVRRWMQPRSLKL